MPVERTSDQLLPRPEGLAGQHGVGRDLLSPDQDVSARRAIRDVVADQAFGFVDSSKHRGRTRSREYAVIHSVSANRTRLAKGARDASVARAARRSAGGESTDGANRSVHCAWQEDSFSHSVAATADSEAMKRSPIRHSPFP